MVPLPSLITSLMYTSYKSVKTGNGASEAHGLFLITPVVGSSSYESQPILTWKQKLKRGISTKRSSRLANYSRLVFNIITDNKLFGPLFIFLGFVGLVNLLMYAALMEKRGQLAALNLTSVNASHLLPAIDRDRR